LGGTLRADSQRRHGGAAAVTRAGGQAPGPLNDSLDKSAVRDGVGSEIATNDAAGNVNKEAVVLEEEAPANIDPQQFLWSSVAFYLVMGGGAQLASSALGVHPDVYDGMQAVNLDAASLWTLPLLASLAFAITQADRFEFLSEVRDIFKVSVVPSLAPLGLGGVVLLSLGAGVGEEAFFRGFLMPFADGQLARLGAPDQAASAGVLVATSVFFGALHAITPAYFIWATGAGLLFGLEYMQDGLGTAAFTHTLYDFLAFGFILVSWPSDEAGDARELPPQGTSKDGGGSDENKR